MAESRVSVKDAAVSVLKAANQPLHVREITKLVQKKSGVSLTGKTPEQTVAATLASSAKRGDTFARTAPNTYALVEAAGSAEKAA